MTLKPLEGVDIEAARRCTSLNEQEKVKIQELIYSLSMTLNKIVLESPENEYYVRLKRLLPRYANELDAILEDFFARDTAYMKAEIEIANNKAKEKTEQNLRYN
jgi:hypothetical protein